MAKRRAAMPAWVLWAATAALIVGAVLGLMAGCGGKPAPGYEEQKQRIIRGVIA